MTVRQLRGLLATFPQDAEIVYDCCSDAAGLEAEQVKLIKAEEEKVIKEGDIFRYHNPRWTKPGQVLNFVTVVSFPGN